MSSTPMAAKRRDSSDKYANSARGRSAIRQFSIEFDREYGLDARTGWSVIINGSVCAELEKWLIVALIKAAYQYYFVWEK